MELIYVFHNCFVLQVDGKTILFDYPAPELLNTKAVSVVREAVRDTDLYVLFSHSHGDHFSPSVIDLIRVARKARFIISKDVAKAFPALEGQPDSLIAVPGRLGRLGELEVEAFPSNDLGVAYLLRLAGVSIYFGGDLANWNWDGDSEDLRLEAFYHKTLDKLVEHPIQIAFSNADARLQNWSGAYEFIERIHPQIFVPMHTFGKTQTLKRFEKNLPVGPTKVWIYEKTGDRLETILLAEGARD